MKSLFSPCATPPPLLPPLPPCAPASAPSPRLFVCHSAPSSLHPFCSRSLLGVSGGKRGRRGPVDKYHVRPFHVFSGRVQICRVTTPHRQAAAALEFLTLAFYFLSLSCLLSVYSDSKNVGVRPPSQLLFLVGPTKSYDMKLSLFYDS